jgi:muconolactone D-isomerase
VRFLVRMTVRIPPGLDPVELEQLKATEKARALELQRKGRWVHLWRVAGRYENYSVFDVSSNDELHDFLSSLPLWPYMDVDVTPLATHPSALDAQPSEG